MRRMMLVLGLAAPVAAAEAGTVIVMMEGVESSRGAVNVALCDTGLSKETCPYKLESPAIMGKMEFRFENIPPGRYAVASFHDVNGNDEFDQGFLGIPLEPYGISKEGGGGLIPSFERSVVPISDGETKIIVKLKR